jgi:hypothetical protein
LNSSGGSKDVEAKGSHYICERKDGLTVDELVSNQSAVMYPATGKPVVAIPERLAPASASNGLLITGNQARSPILAAHALIGGIDAAVGPTSE